MMVTYPDLQISYATINLWKSNHVFTVGFLEEKKNKTKHELKVMKLSSIADTNICIRDDVALIISVALKMDKQGYVCPLSN